MKTLQIFSHLKYVSVPLHILGCCLSVCITQVSNIFDESILLRGIFPSIVKFMLCRCFQMECIVFLSSPLLVFLLHASLRSQITLVIVWKTFLSILPSRLLFKVQVSRLYNRTSLQHCTPQVIDHVLSLLWSVLFKYIQSEKHYYIPADVGMNHVNLFQQSIS